MVISLEWVVANDEFVVCGVVAVAAADDVVVDDDVVGVVYGFVDEAVGAAVAVEFAAAALVVEAVIRVAVSKKSASKRDVPLQGGLT